MVANSEERVVRPILRLLKERGISYRGVLFSGMMADGRRLNCLEYNVRFGDPEIQSLVLRLRQGFGDALLQAALGEPIQPPQVLPSTAVSVVVASEGYPGAVRKGLPISFGPMPMGVKLFHAGTASLDGSLVTAGGRVVCASAAASRLHDARRLASAGAAAVQFDGAYFRKDIAQDQR
jgi:phosphoribosylamine--glycine ligase